MASTKLQLALTAFIHTFLNRHHHLFWSQQLQVPIMLNLTRTNGLIAAIYSHREGTLLTSSRLVISIRVFVTLFYTHTHTHIYQNRSNFEAHYGGTGPEIWRQTNGHLNAFVSGAGALKYLSPHAKSLNMIMGCRHWRHGCRSWKISQIEE